MTDNDELLDRRQELRFKMTGVAIVHGELPPLRGRIVDIGVGGMVVQLSNVEGLEPWRDRAVAVDVRIDAHLGEWLIVIGGIRRLDLETGRMAIHFDTVPAELKLLLATETIDAGIQRSIDKALN
jgi:hypothetical protein